MPNLDIIRSWRSVQLDPRYSQADPEKRAAVLNNWASHTYQQLPPELRQEFASFYSAKYDAIQAGEPEKAGIVESAKIAYREGEEQQDFSRLKSKEQFESLLDAYAQDTVQGRPETGFIGSIVGSLAAGVDEAAQGAVVGAGAGAAIGSMGGGVGAAPGAVTGAGVGAIGAFAGASARQTYSAALKENFFKLLDAGQAPEEAFNTAQDAAIRTTGIMAVADLINPATKGATALARIGKEAAQNAAINTGASVADVVQTRASGIEIGTEEAVRRVGFESAGGLFIGGGIQGIRELGARAVGPRPQPGGDAAVPPTDTQQAVVPPVEPPTVEPRGASPESPAATPETPGATPPDVATPQAPEGSVVPETTSQIGSETPNFQGEAQSAPVSAPGAESPLTPTPATPEGQPGNILSPTAGQTGEQKERLTAKRLGAADPTMEQLRQENSSTRLYNAQTDAERAKVLGALTDDELSTVIASGEAERLNLKVAAEVEALSRAQKKFETTTNEEEKRLARGVVDKAFEPLVRDATKAAQHLQQMKRIYTDPELFVGFQLELRRRRTGQDIEVSPEDRQRLVEIADRDMKSAQALDEADADVRRAAAQQKELQDLEDELGGPDYMLADGGDDATLRIPIEKAKKLLSNDSDGTAAVDAEAMPIWDRYKEAAAKRLSFAFGDGKPKAKPSLERFTQDAGSAIQESIKIEKVKNPKVDRNVPKFKDLLENPEKHREIIQTALDNLDDTKLSAAAKEAAREQLEGLLDAADFEGTVGAKVSGKILADRLRTTKLPVRKMMQAGMSDDQLRIALVNDVMGSLGEMTPGAKRKAERIIGNTVDSFLKDLRQKLADAKAKAEARKAAAKPKDKRPNAEQVLTPLWDQYKDSLGKQIADAFGDRTPGKVPSLAQFSGQAKKAITDSLDIPKGPKAADKTIPTLKDIFENPGKHRQILERAREKVTASKLSDRAKRKALESIDNLLQAGRPLAEQIAESPTLKLVQKTIRESKLPLRQMLADGVTDDQMRDIIMRNVRDQLGDMDQDAQQRLMAVVEQQTDKFLNDLRAKFNAKQISKELRQKFQLRQKVDEASDALGGTLADQLRFLERASKPEIPEDIASLRKVLAERKRLVEQSLKEKFARMSQAEADQLDATFRFHKKMGEVSGRGFFDTALSMYQGNLLTTKSLAYNLVGNLVFIPARIFADKVAAPVDTLLMGRMSGQGRSMIAPSMADTVTAVRTAFTKGLNEAKSIMFQGRRPNELLKGENMQGFAPMTAFAQLAMGIAGKDNVVSLVKGTPFESFFRDTFELPTVDGKIPKNLLAAKALESVGFLPEAFFRTLAATDAIFKTGAEAFELSRQARMRGLKPGTDGYNLFMAVPPPGIADIARERGLRSTFQQDTAVTRVAQRVLDAVPSMVKDIDGAEDLARFVIRMQAPFVKTPINVIGETIGYFPPVAGVNFLAQLHKVRANVNKLAKLRAKGLGDSSPEVSAVLKEISNAQSSGARAVGQFVAGVTAWMTADYLLDKGIISAGDRDDSTKERNANTPVMPRYNVNLSALERLATGDSDTRVRPEDIMVGYEKLGVLGTLFASRADLHKKYKDKNPSDNPLVKQMNDAVFGVMGAAQFSLDSSFLMNTAGLLDALRGRGAEKYVTNLAASVAHIIVPNSYSRVTTANLPYRPDLNGGKGTTMGEYMENSIRMKLGMAQAIPAEIGPWGDPIPMTPEGSTPLVRALIDPLNTQGSTTDPKNHVLRRIFDATQDTDVYPSIPGGTSGVVTYRGTQVPLPNNLLSEYRATVGRMRKQTTERLLQASLFKGTNYTAMVKVLKRQYEAGLERGTKVFIAQNRDQIELLRQKVLDEEAKKKLRLGLQ